MATRSSDSRDAPAFVPLDGIRIIDFSRLLAGPYATMTLAELGADVVKVELPGVGDETRSWGPPFVGHSSSYFHAVNRGKRSIALDLGEPHGREAADALIATADVVIENFRPGVADRLGIGAERLLARNPRLVYGSITGFGTVGPMAEQAGTEVIVEAESGLMSITGMSGGDPVRFGVAMVDIATGMSLNNAVLAALLERERTGKGRRVEVSLYATALSSLGTVIAGAAASGTAPRAWGSAHPSIVPYRAFSTKDGHVVLGATNDPMFVRLAAALELTEELGAERWAGNAARVADRDEIEEILGHRLAARTTADVVERLQRHRVLVAPVLTPDSAATSPQAQALGLVQRDRDLLITRSALGTNGTRVLGGAPALGEHSAELLAELGLTAPIPSPEGR